MKGPHTSSKKLLTNQKPTPPSNPYSDYPSPVQPKTIHHGTINNKPISQMIQIIKNGNKHIKSNPLNEAKGISHSKSAKKVSLAKIGSFNSDINAKKKQQKGFRNQKFNDYFQAEPKRDKYNTNTSNLSSQSNSSVNSIKSQTNKNMLFNIHSRGADKIVAKITHPKEEPISKLIKRQSHSIKINSEFNEIFHLNQNLKIRALEKMDDKKKSLSSNSFNIIKNNSEGDIKKIVSFKKAPTTLTKCSKNPQKTCEQPKIIQLQVKPKGVKSENKIPFIPSASKLRNSQHPKKSIQNNLSKVSQGFKNCVEIPQKIQQQKYQLKIKNNSTLTSSLQFQQFEVNNIVRLKIVSNSIAPSFASFKIIKKLVKDDKTSIYLVMQLVTKLLYCLKKCLVTPSQSKIQQMKGLNKLQYLIRQAKIGQLINHPFLIKTYCTLVDNKSIYHLSEYIEGESLYAFNKYNFYGPQHIQRDALGLQKQSLSRIVSQISNIKQILHQLLEGLNYLHERGIIHRDLKPSNILITHKDTYKIGDFGTSIFYNSSQPIGTLDYAAPQIMLRQPYNASIDMWSVGCIAYQLYIGYPPFFNENRDTTVKKIIDCDYDCSNINDEDLVNLISRLLQRKWEKRLTAKSALQHSFFKQFKQV